MNGGTITGVFTDLPELEGVSIVFTEEDRDACDPENLQAVPESDDFIYTITSAIPAVVSSSYLRNVRKAATRYDQAQ